LLHPPLTMEKWVRGVIFCSFFGLFVWVTLSPVPDLFRSQFYLLSLPVFGIVLLPLTAVYLWGLCLVVFRHYRLNWALLCDLHPTKSLTPGEVWDFGSLFTILFTFVFYLQFFQANFESPLLPVVVCICACFFPFEYFYPDTRVSFFKILWSVVTAPFGRVRFVESFVGDVLTSMPKVIYDLAYSLCFYRSVTPLFHPLSSHQKRSFRHLSSESFHCLQPSPFVMILCGLPLYWRLAQCLNQFKATKNKAALANAGKYAMSLAVVLYGASFTHPTPFEWTRETKTWIFLYVISTLYCILWDLKMDWGLLEKGERGLRKNLIYPSWVYYPIIVVNIFFRFFWIFTISPHIGQHHVHPAFLSWFSSTAELIRRFVWALVRFEWEYHTTGKARSENPIAV